MKAARYTKTLAILLAVIMLLGALASCSKKSPTLAQPKTGTENKTTAPDDSKPNTGDAEPDKTKPVADKEDEEAFKLAFAESYDEVKKTLESLREESGAKRGGMMTNGGMVAEDAVMAETAAMDSPAMSIDSAAEAATTSGAGAVDAGYSETNVQVNGVDEGDIVKTDGKFIYILRDRQLTIVSAAGGDTAEVSTTTVLDEEVYDKQSGSYSYANEIYVSGDRLAVIANESSWDSSGERYINNETAVAIIYDISDRSAPKLVAKLGQDGYHNTSRLIGSTLYLISNYYIYDYDTDTQEPDVFIPRYYTNGVAALIAPGDIFLPPIVESECYAVISAIDLENAETKTTQSILGGSGAIYMNAGNLYIATSRGSTEESEPYSADQYTVTDYTNKSVTDIARFSLENGGLELAATGSVSGYLLNQFSMDEYEGNLRVVTTLNDYSYSIYVDEKYGWENYDWEESVSTNSLYVLNENLELTGAVEKLGEGERVYSVRFDGAIGYFVTFRQTDPLFAVDLSNPEAPEVLSALKIPGFSDYLHVYSDGRLFGLGMQADEETGRTECMKLSMFDVSDPANVTECAKLALEENYWSEALYNHKAILISADKNMIAFPLENEYVVYGYSEQEGFYLRSSFAVGDYMYDARGMYIGDYIYICSQQAVQVFTMDDFANVADIAFQ